MAPASARPSPSPPSSTARSAKIKLCARMWAS
jgi:hypothetical protein